MRGKYERHNTRNYVKAKERSQNWNSNYRRRISSGNVNKKLEDIRYVFLKKLVSFLPKKIKVEGGTNL